jgi:hypothetical protein
MSKEIEWAANVHAIGRLKISDPQSSIVEDYNTIEAQIINRRV